MHELSIAARVVEEATEHCRAGGGRRVAAVTLRIGDLAGVHEGPLRLGFEMLRPGTCLESAELRIVRVPVRIWCPACAAEVALPGVQRLACPNCGTVSGDIRSGRELDLESLELLDAEPARA